VVGRDCPRTFVTFEVVGTSQIAFIVSCGAVVIGTNLLSARNFIAVSCVLITSYNPLERLQLQFLMSRRGNIIEMIQSRYKVPCAVQFQATDFCYRLNVWTVNSVLLCE
jgi:hypothetical protein